MKVVSNRIEHDSLFKELLTTSFVDLIRLFCPNLYQHLDSEFTVVPMQQEILIDIGSSERHVVDLLMRVKFKEQDAYFLIHVENQASPQSDFPRRMFGYFSRLTLKYRLPVYPIVLFTYDEPKRAEPSSYVVKFPDKTVLKFDYTAIQLNRLDWRKYLKADNPLATALMAKMRIAPKDRPKVRAECLRLLASHKLDPARTKLIGVFIDRYLQMTADEMKMFERELAGFDPAERETTMEMMSSWELKGLEQGIVQGIERGLKTGKEELALLQIRKRFGIVPEDLVRNIDRLSSQQLNELGQALFDFASLEELQEWVARS